MYAHPQSSSVPARGVRLWGMSSAARPLPPDLPLSLTMTPEVIAAEYEACRDPDGSVNWDRFRAMSRRLYGVELQEGTPLSPEEQAQRESAWREVIARWEAMPEDPDPEPLDVAPANTDAPRRM
jgi:hypothetical protein